ncbi:dTDP-4-dehydrorhamnose reductase [Roseovarius phycicola]|uniref:dTDP-4-dehydrorhamnose reductase n=1 Tax=Roseovarius phycicola TaxID=3080976 RepID=A0ABZ2HKW4_9RHOB
MTLLVFGKTGQVSTELGQLLEAVCLGRAEADLSDPAACAEAIKAANPSVVINAAAYTAVDRAEEEEDLATIINGDTPGKMATACAELGVPFVHISTDYVFDGQGKAPFAPDAETNPLGAYGRSKLKGEALVRASGATHAILRTSWVFSAHGNNFVKTMLRVSETRNELKVVDDQIGGPTSARSIARACLSLADQLGKAPGKSGTYHFSGAPDISWHGFATEIFAQAGKPMTIHAIPTSQYPTPAVRPGNSRMDCSSTQQQFGIAQPEWQADLAAVLEELNALG